MRTDSLEKVLEGVEGPTIVCAQAGEVNTGSYDPFGEIVEVVRKTDAWLHVDGAFGLWVAASPARRHLARRGCRSRLVGDRRAQMAERAVRLRSRPLRQAVRPSRVDDDARRLLRRPRAMGSRRCRLDAGVVASSSCVHRLRRAALTRSRRSRRARRRLLRPCRSASQTARLDSEDAKLLNDVVINQVLFRFGDDETTSAVLARVQESGEAWMGGTMWDDRAAIRISVSGWRTTRGRHRPHDRGVRIRTRRRLALSA